MNVHGVPADAVADWWPILLPFFEGFEARSDGRVSVHSLVADVRERDRQVWIAGDERGVAMVALTRVLVQADGTTTIAIDHCAGERMEEWRELFDDEMRAWAAALGARRIVSLARPGWSKWAKTRGYRETHREMMLDLEGSDDGR